MSNINIENLSYDMNMDREAMDAISGSGFVSWVKGKLKSAWRNRVRIAAYILRWVGRRYGSPSPRR